MKINTVPLDVRTTCSGWDRIDLSAGVNVRPWVCYLDQNDQDRSVITQDTTSDEESTTQDSSESDQEDEGTSILARYELHFVSFNNSLTNIYWKIVDNFVNLQKLWRNWKNSKPKTNLTLPLTSLMKPASIMYAENLDFSFFLFQHREEIPR